MYDTNNVFAKIIRGEIPAKIVLENEHAISFYDVNPVSSKHVLVIPKGQFENIFDFIKNARSHEKTGFWELFDKTAEKLGVINDCNVLVNVGAGVYFKQTVQHFHLHLIAGEKIKEIADF